MMEAKRNATGWQIRCVKCDHTEPWDKPGGRLKSADRKYICGCCPHCKRIRFRVIEKVPDPRAPK